MSFPTSPPSDAISMQDTEQIPPLPLLRPSAASTASLTGLPSEVKRPRQRVHWPRDDSDIARASTNPFASPQERPLSLPSSPYMSPSKPSIILSGGTGSTGAAPSTRPSPSRPKFFVHESEHEMKDVSSPAGSSRRPLGGGLPSPSPLRAIHRPGAPDSLELPPRSFSPPRVDNVTPQGLILDHQRDRSVSPSRSIFPPRSRARRSMDSLRSTAGDQEVPMGEAGKGWGFRHKAHKLVKKHMQRVERAEHVAEMGGVDPEMDDSPSHTVNGGVLFNLLQLYSNSQQQQQQAQAAAQGITSPTRAYASSEGFENLTAPRPGRYASSSGYKKTLSTDSMASLLRPQFTRGRSAESDGLPTLSRTRSAASSIGFHHSRAQFGSSYAYMNSDPYASGSGSNSGVNTAASSSTMLPLPASMSRPTALRHKSQDLEEPYIPSRSRVDPVVKVTKTLTKLLPEAITSYFPSGGEDNTPGAIATLMTTTNNLSSVASPALSALAPSKTKRYGADGKPRYTLSRYSTKDEPEPVQRRSMGRSSGGSRPASWADEKGWSSSIPSGPPTPGEEGKSFGFRRGKRRAQEIYITMHIANIMQRQDFILRLGRALMIYGAPTHRIESQLEAMAKVLEINAAVIYLPSVLIIAFGDEETRTSETHFVKAAGGLDLGKLMQVHSIYRQVLHDEIGAPEGTAEIKALIKSPETYSVPALIVIGGMCSATVSVMAFSGSFVDMLMVFWLGGLLAFIQYKIAARNMVFLNVFEICTAFIVSFASRALSATGYFCYVSLASSGVVLILPGFIILCGALELASRNIVSGSIRVVYAIVYSLFLGFGIAMGGDLYDVIDPASLRRRLLVYDPNSVASTVSLSGSFALNNANTTTAMAFQDAVNGTFTFSNGTSSLSTGSIVCYRDPSWAWYQQSVPRWWLFLIVPMFALSLSLWNKAPLRNRELPVMIIIASAGYAVNYWISKVITSRPDVVSAISMFAVGVLGQLWSRIGRGSAFTSMVTGVLLVVPSGIAAAGGLAMSGSTSNSGYDSVSQGFLIGLRMMVVAIGLVVGLFMSTLAVYPMGKFRGSIFSF